MGIYYSPPSPNIGAAQPLTPQALTPPQSGPAPSNPVFNAAAAAALISTVVGAWSANAGPLPPRPNFIPPPASAPPQRVQTTPTEVLRWWVPDAPMAQTANRLAISSPAPQNPPFAGGARLPTAVVLAWIPPPPLPQTAAYRPPISAPAPPSRTTADKFLSNIGRGMGRHG